MIILEAYSVLVAIPLDRRKVHSSPDCSIRRSMAA